MDRLTSMTVFARVAATRSFSAAAKELGMSQATASKHVQTLESWIGVRLLNRTTRRVALTEAGETFFAQCTRILEDVETARHTGRPQAKLHGTLRITAPVSIGSTILGSAIVGFMRENPGLALNVTLVDRPVDLIEEGYDLALQVVHGKPQDAAHEMGMIVQPIMEVEFIVCAAPEYLTRAGTPATPQDLANHVCLTDTRHPGDRWQFLGPDGVIDVPVSGMLKSDNGLLRREAARAGGGVLLLPAIVLRDDIAKGRLVPLLPGYHGPPASLCAICPGARVALPKLRRLIAFLTERLGETDGKPGQGTTASGSAGRSI